MTEDIEDLCVGRHVNAYHAFTGDETEKFRTDLAAWYARQRRKLPWRGDDPDFKSVSPYGVWVSEVMLQQTRVETVKEYWKRWMRVFPTVESLASAPIEEVNEQCMLSFHVPQPRTTASVTNSVLRGWTWLLPPLRAAARRCQAWYGVLCCGVFQYYACIIEFAACACCRAVVSQLKGELPRTAAELQEIPGIGPYTAGAIASICFGQRAPLVDGNVIRVLARVRAIAADPKDRALNALCWRLAGDVVPAVAPGDFNQALMELGATVCTPKVPCPARHHSSGSWLFSLLQSPKCGECPVRSVCRAAAEIEAKARPASKQFAAAECKAGSSAGSAAAAAAEASASESKGKAGAKSKAKPKSKAPPAPTDACTVCDVESGFVPSSLFMRCDC